MNDLELHNRLSGLADDLAPDADPYAQASSARALHRRQRRTRLGVTGAVAAVTALVIGVPTAVNSLSAPERDDVAAPSTTEVAPPALTGDASLRELADALRVALGDGAPLAGGHPRVAERPCPDAAELLSERIGVTVRPTARASAPGPTIGSGCSYAKSWNNNGTKRLALSLSSSSAGDASTLPVEDLPKGCAATALPEKAPATYDRTHVLVCRGEVPSMAGTYPDQLMWRVALPDSRGDTWVLTALLGTSLPESTGVESIVALRDVVQDELVPPTDGDIAAEAMAARIAELSPSLSLVAPPEGSTCPDVSSLDRYGVELQPGGSPTTGCQWSTGAGESPTSAPLSASFRYYADNLPPVPAIDCPTAPVPGSSPEAEVERACGGLPDGWKVTIPDADGRGGWVFLAAGGAADPSGDEPTASGLLPALVQAADQAY